jgi:hypothetical protein
MQRLPSRKKSCCLNELSEIILREEVCGIAWVREIAVSISHWLLSVRVLKKVGGELCCSPHMFNISSLHFICPIGLTIHLNYIDYKTLKLGVKKQSKTYHKLFTEILFGTLQPFALQKVWEIHGKFPFSTRRRWDTE